MEILQTIWTALTTENEILIKYASIPMTLIEVYISMLLFTTILNIKYSKKQGLYYVLGFSSIAIISLLFIPTPYNTFVNVIASPILVYFIFKTSILKSIISEVIPYIVSVILISFLTNIYTIIFKINSSCIITIPIHRFGYSISQYVFMYIFYIFCKKFDFNIAIKHNFESKNRIMLLLNFFVGIIALAIQSYITTKYSSILPYEVQSSAIFILLIYFIISILSLCRTNKLEITTENLEQEKLYNKTITLLYDSIRSYRHDFNNKVQAMGGYIYTDNMEGLKEFYTGLLDDCQKANNLAILNPELINNPAIYSLLTSKYYQASELDISMNFEIFLDLQTLNIRIYDLITILGILLDNAIEASQKCDEKTINVIIRKDNKVNRQLFIIENTYTNKDVDTDRIFEKGYTSKTDDNSKDHGLGLWEVRKILKKNNNLNLFTTKDNKFFKQQLEIYF